MKLISLCLISLNIITFPAIALAKPVPQNNTRDSTYLISHGEAETENDDSQSEETKDDRQSRQKKKK